MSLTVVHGNAYVGNKTTGRAIRKLRAHLPDVIVTNESRHVRRIRGYRQHVAPYGEPRGRTDVRLWVKKSLRYLGTMSVVTQNPVAGYPAAHERQIVAALFDHPDTGKTAVIGLHPTPAPKALTGDDPENRWVKSYDRAMDATEQLVAALHGLGFVVVVAGDVQLRPTAPKRDWNPGVRLADMGLTVTIWEHLDLIAADKRLIRIHSRVLAPAGPGTGSDHPFLAASYTRRKKP